MIYLTGDTHIPIDIEKLNEKNFIEQKKLTKKDYVIILGDFGGTWDKSQQRLQWLEWLKQKNFTTLFVDGNHENFDLLNSYPIDEWNGGKVHFINDSIIHLMRGQIFTIDNKKFFTFGGADSIDKARRLPRISWWPEELPNKQEYDEGLDNLEKYNWTVDYIVSHACSRKTFDKLSNCSINLKPYYTPINDYFDLLEEKVNFKHWYFGHYHDDREIDEKHTVLYDKIIQI